MAKEKKKDPEKVAALQARKQAKSEKLAKKSLKKESAGLRAEGVGSGSDSDNSEEDIDELLKSFADKAKLDAAVSHRALLAPPSPRANSTLTYVGSLGGCGGLSTTNDVLVLFGGEVRADLWK